MNSTKNITFVVGEDWEGVYIDGVLVVEGHSISYRDVLRAQGLTDYGFKVCDNGWLDARGSLPYILDCVVTDA